LLQLALTQIKQEKNQKTAQILAGILRDLLGDSLPRLLRVLARKEDFLEVQINQVFDRLILEFRLNEEQAIWLAD
jgi:uncharacterized membrane protein YheB (UPF0754 family)